MRISSVLVAVTVALGLACGGAEPTCLDGARECREGDELWACTDGQWQLHTSCSTLGEACDALISPPGCQAEAAAPAGGGGRGGKGRRGKRAASGGCTPGELTCSDDHQMVVICEQGALQVFEDCSETARLCESHDGAASCITPG